MSQIILHKEEALVGVSLAPAYEALKQVSKKKNLTFFE